MAYGVVYGALLGGAAIVALILGSMVPGVAGVVVFVTVGLAIIAAAPTVTRRLFVRVHEAVDARQQGEPAGGQP